MSFDPSIPTRLTFGGLASGLDTGAIVEALMRVERRPLDVLQTRKSALETERALFRDINSKLLALRDAARELDNLSSGQSGPAASEEFLAYKASSTDETILTATAGSSASPGTTSIRVTQLAAVGRRISKTYAIPDSIVATNNKNVTISYGGASPIVITAGPSGLTLNQIRDAINSDANNDGSVRSEVIFDGTNYRLVISGTQTGASHDVTVTSNISGFIDTTKNQVAKDATLVVFGLTITRESNEIDDVIPGVTLRLNGLSLATPTTDAETITVSRDDDAVAAKLEKLVKAYNDVREFLLAQSRLNEATKKAGPLSGDATLRGIERLVQTAAGGLYAFAGSSVSSLSEIGLRFDASGKLSLDRSKLGEALDDDALGVRRMLSGDGVSDGAASAIARSLEPMVRAGDGTLAVREQSFETRLRSFEDQIGRLQARLVQREESLRLRFTQLERLVSELQGQSSFLGRIGS